MIYFCSNMTPSTENDNFENTDPRLILIKASHENFNTSSWVEYGFWNFQHIFEVWKIEKVARIKKRVHMYIKLFQLLIMIWYSMWNCGIFLYLNMNILLFTMLLSILFYILPTLGSKSVSSLFETVVDYSEADLLSEQCLMQLFEKRDY